MTRTREEITREVAALVLLVGAVLVLLATMSYHPLDPSLFAAGSDTVHNWLSTVGAAIAGVLVTLFGLPTLGLPVLMAVVGWRWLKGREAA